MPRRIRTRLKEAMDNGDGWVRVRLRCRVLCMWRYVVRVCVCVVVRVCMCV